MNDRNDAQPTVLLVHGAWHGSWCWYALVPELRGRGFDTVAVDLPSVGDPRAGLYDDAAVVRAAAEDAAGPVVVLAHSYGALPASEGLVGVANVTRIIFLAALMLDEGQSLSSLLDEPLPNEGGLIAVRDDSADAFYDGVPAAGVAEAVAKLLPQSLRSFDEPLHRAAWRQIPSTYVVCEQDGALAPDLQVFLAAQASETRHLQAGHSPFLSDPAGLADLLEDIVTTAAAAARA